MQINFDDVIEFFFDEMEQKQKLQSDDFGLFVANEWKRLLDPFTPRDTGELMGEKGPTVDIKPFEIHYNAPYAERVYFSEGWEFKKKNLFATDHWDEAAIAAGQQEKLEKTINAALESGRFD